jgi:RNA polymerase sigma factor for flagellar operon FliA
LQKVFSFPADLPKKLTQSDISPLRFTSAGPGEGFSNFFAIRAQVRRARAPIPPSLTTAREIHHMAVIANDDLQDSKDSAGPETSPLPNGPLTQDEIRALIEEHLPLVNHVVFQVAVHFPRHVDRDELARAGALGLVEAAKRYDEARGVPFNRFAAQRIRGAIIDGVRAADWAPRSVRALARRLDGVEQSLANQLGRVPSLAETADALGVSRDELDRMRDRLFRSVVLAFDSLAGDSDDEELTLVDVLTDSSVVEPSEELEQRELESYVRDAVALLPERHRLVVVGYFLEERTSQDLARFLGVTESRVSQMRTEALNMLRQGIEAQYEAADPEPGEGVVARRRANYAAAIAEASAWGERISASAPSGDRTAALVDARSA